MVLIEVGKSYKITPQFKKSVIEIEIYKDADGRELRRETVWRTGEYIVHLESEAEVMHLTGSLNSHDWRCSDYENWELDHTWDGCSEDWRGDAFDDLETEWNELAEDERDEWFDFRTWIEDEKGFDCDDLEVVIENGIEIEEYTNG